MSWNVDNLIYYQTLNAFIYLLFCCWDGNATHNSNCECFVVDIFVSKFLLLLLHTYQKHTLSIFNSK